MLGLGRDVGEVDLCINDDSLDGDGILAGLGGNSENHDHQIRLSNYRILRPLLAHLQQMHMQSIMKQKTSKKVS